MLSALVSVIIPTFNRAYCLRRAIDSVLNQTHRKVEVIVVDDGSTDETSDLVRSVYSANKQVRYVHQANSGVSAARNHGFALATGEFVSLLDSDDEWYPWKLSVQLACLSFLPDAGMIWTDMDAVGADGSVVQQKYLRTMYGAYQRLGDRKLFDKQWGIHAVMTDAPAALSGSQLFAGDIFSEMILGNLVHTSTVLLRRERLKQVTGFDLSLKFSGEDYDFHLRTCRAGPVAFLDAASIRYQVGMADALTRPEYMIHLALNNLQTIEAAIRTDRAKIRLSDRAISTRLAGANFWVGQAYLDLNDSHKARPYLRRGLVRDPANLLQWKNMVSSYLPKRLRHGIRNLVRDLKGKPSS